MSSIDDFNDELAELQKKYDVLVSSAVARQRPEFSDIGAGTSPVYIDEDCGIVTHRTHLSAEYIDRERMQNWWATYRCMLGCLLESGNHLTRDESRKYAYDEAVFAHGAGPEHLQKLYER
jgi:hypothetical protein